MHVRHPQDDVFAVMESQLCKDAHAVVIAQDLTLYFGHDLAGCHGAFGASELERALEGEMTAHLGYEKGERGSEGRSNPRNGSSTKRVKTGSTEVKIEVPRDRQGTFEPEIVKKRQGRLDGFNDTVISLYARGMSTLDIRGHLEELCGIEVSPELISKVTDAVLQDVGAWRKRSLAAVWPIVCTRSRRNPNQHSLEVIPELVTFMAIQVGEDETAIGDYQRRRETLAELLVGAEKRRKIDRWTVRVRPRSERVSGGVSGSSPAPRGGGSSRPR